MHPVLFASRVENCLLTVFIVFMRQICHTRSGGLALCGAAHRGRRTKATLMAKACRRGSRTNLGLVGVAGEEAAYPTPRPSILNSQPLFLSSSESFTSGAGRRLD